MHFLCARKAGVLLNISANFWRISSPDSDERSGTAQALQSAKQAELAGAPDAVVVGALLHDATPRRG